MNLPIYFHFSKRKADGCIVRLNDFPEKAIEILVYFIENYLLSTRKPSFSHEMEKTKRDELFKNGKKSVQKMQRMKRQEVQANTYN
jgi:hypothetical protein